MQKNKIKLRKKELIFFYVFVGFSYYENNSIKNKNQKAFKKNKNLLKK